MAELRLFAFRPKNGQQMLQHRNSAMQAARKPAAPGATERRSVGSSHRPLGSESARVCVYRKFRLILTMVLVFSLLFVLCVQGQAEEGDDPGQQAEETYEPEEPSAAPETEAPVVPLPVVPQPVVTEAPATAPPTAAPATAARTEAPGTVNLRMYVYTTAGAPAAGYAVSLSSAQTTTNSEGLANFSSLPVAQQQVAITAPDGSTCTGRLYLSRSGATGVTDQAMGGTYGVDIARGLSDLYMVVTFEPGGPLTIRTLSESAPALPTSAPAASQAGAAAATTAANYPVKSLTATFVDRDGRPIPGLRVGITAESAAEAELSTDSAGSISIPSAPYGHYRVSTTTTDGQTGQFDLTINPALRTGVAENTGANMVVDAATTANHLYLRFTQAGAGFVLTDASDSPIGGANPVLIGVVVVAAIAVILIVVVILLRRRNGMRRGTVTTMQVKSQRKINYDPSAPSDAKPRRTTGGANKFDDRSKM